MLPTVKFSRAALVLIGAVLAYSPSFAGDAYPDALAKCRKNAEAAQDVTDFKCDWKTVVRGAPGSALTGKFRYREKGLTGTMTVLEGDGPVLVSVLTVSKDPNAHTCSAGFQGTRNDNDELVVKPGAGDDSGCEVRIKSVPGNNIVSVTANDQCSTFCGMRAIFAGKWQLWTK